MKRSDVEAYYAPLIREITKMREAGTTYDEITTKLNERGSLTAGGRPFTRCSFAACMFARLASGT